MNTGLKLPLGSFKEMVKQYVAPYPSLADLIFGRRGKIIYLVSMATVITWVGYGQFYFPASKKIERIEKRLEQTSKKINDLQQEFPDVVREQKKLEEKDKALETIRERLRQEEARLPTRSELDKVLAQLTTSSGGSSVSIVSVKPAEDQKKKLSAKKAVEDAPFYPMETFEIQLLSRFWDLIGYLSRLEQVSPYFSFPVLLVDAIKTKSAYPSVKLQVTTLLNDGVPSKDRGEIFKKDVAPAVQNAEEKDPFGIAGKMAQKDLAEPKFKLSGIIWQGGQKVAIVNNEALREGDSLGNAKMVSISDNKVVLEENGFQHELELSS